MQNATPALWFAIYPVGVAARVQVTQGFIVLFCPAVSGFCNLMEWQHQFFPVLPHLPAYLWLLLWLRCLVLYLLGITLIDPIKYNLLFERFLLPERAGLYPSDVTVIGEDINSNQYVEVMLENHKTYKIDKDAQLVVKRMGTDAPIVVYADELQANDLSLIHI